MEDLVAWLTAQLDKDQEITERVRADAVAIRRAGNLARDPGAADRYDAQVRWATADNEAKRRIIDDCEEYHGQPFGQAGAAVTDGLSVRVLQYLALPYADRPGYQEEWKP